MWRRLNHTMEGQYVEEVEPYHGGPVWHKQKQMIFHLRERRLKIGYFPCARGK